MILIVEDEKNLGSTLLEQLVAKGYEAVWATSVAEARFEIDRKSYELVLLDVGLPDGNGYDVAQYLRKRSPQTAVVFLTAFGNPEDRVRGLELGAEDYMVKPFHLKELFLRVHNALRRVRLTSGNDEIHQASIGRAVISFDRFEISTGGTTEQLSLKECALLKLLVASNGKVLTREEILNRVWGEEQYPSTRTVDNFILRLRKLVEPDPDQPSYIRSVRGVGYQLCQTDI